MADLATQVADMNASAKSLLTKYDGAFSKLENLSEEKQKELNDLVSSKLKEIDKIKEDMGNQTVDIDVDKIKAEIDKKVKSALDEIGKVSSSSGKACFCAIRTTSITSTGAFNITNYNKLNVDNYNSFDKKTGIFKTPKKGIYRFSVDIQIEKGDGTDDTQELFFKINNNETEHLNINNKNTSSGIELTQHYECIVDLKLGDKVIFSVSSIDRGQIDKVFFIGVEI